MVTGASPVFGGLKVGEVEELIGGGSAVLPPLVSLELDEPDELELLLEELLPLEVGRAVVPAWTDSEAVQAIGRVTEPDALPAWALILTLPVIVRSAVNVIVAAPSDEVVSLSELIVPPVAMNRTDAPLTGRPAASFTFATTKTVPPQRSTTPGLAISVIVEAPGVPPLLLDELVDVVIPGVPETVGVGQKTCTRTSLVTTPLVVASVAVTRALVIPG